LVYIIDKNGQPLMPTERYGKIRRLLKDNKVKVLKVKPFTIQLLYDTTDYKQNIVLGIDSGYENIGFSAITDKKELISGEIKLLKGISERIKEKFSYRHTRRTRLRYRKPKFNNRRKKYKKEWLAPSIQHKLDSHVKIINKIKSILPITDINIEVANFDIQKINNPEIKSNEYQQGEQLGFWNIREYVLYRDDHKCQNPNCKNKDKQIILEIHHLGYWNEDRTDRPNNLITLCTKCHIPKNHLQSGFLYKWKPKLKSFKPETFMSTIRWKLISLTNSDYTYGYITKNNRIKYNIEKSHANDAFVIAGGINQYRINPFEVIQVKRNNRSLSKFYDAKYIDIRTGKEASGQELFSGRRTRNKNLNDENLRKYRGKKISKGKYSVRKQRYSYQNYDEIIWNGERHICGGMGSLGKVVVLKDLNNKQVNVKYVKPYRYGKGLFFK
jgi:hypothetical protein